MQRTVPAPAVVKLSHVGVLFRVVADATPSSLHEVWMRFFAENARLENIGAVALSLSYHGKPITEEELVPDKIFCLSIFPLCPPMTYTPEDMMVLRDKFWQELLGRDLRELTRAVHTDLQIPLLLSTPIIELRAVELLYVSPTNLTQHTEFVP